MKTKLFYFFFCSIIISSFSQFQIEVLSEIDSSKVKLGQEIEYKIQIKSEKIDKVLFPEKFSFLPFEILEELDLDTLKKDSNFLLTKNFKLINFESGSFWVPKQKIIINGFSFFTDSIKVDIDNIVVDTLKQPLYDIKPIIKVKRDNKDILAVFFWFIFLGVFFLISILIYKYLEKRKFKIEEKILPFDRAILELKKLQEVKLNQHREYKVYYSRLTEIVRRYLEEEVKVSALESTSEELLSKLELLKEAGKMELENQTILNLKKVLEKADLVKFAKHSTNLIVAKEDRTLVEEVVVKTKEAIPEPTYEEIKVTEQFQYNMILKKRKKRIFIALGGLVILSILALVLAISVYGYYPVRDELFRYPTKKIISGNWVKSQYGSPPLQLETPKVLIRNKSLDKKNKIFNFSGDWDNPFIIQLTFSPPISSKKDNELTKEEKDDLGRKIINKIVEGYQKEGATNIFPKNEVIMTKGGIEALKVFGSLNLENNKGESVRCKFFTIAFILNQSFIKLKMIYDKEDRYGEVIEKRIIESLELIKEL